MTTQTQKKKILIIEDEVALLTILQIRLSQANFEVFTASDGNAGGDLATTVKPDVILLDIMMPGKDGFTLLRELKGNEETCNIPVIVVTAKDRIEDACTLEGAQGFIMKPFDYQKLEDSINSILERD